MSQISTKLIHAQFPRDYLKILTRKLIIWHRKIAIIRLYLEQLFCWHTKFLRHVSTSAL